MALARPSSKPSTLSTRSKNSLATEPTGSLNTLPKKFAKAAIKFHNTPNASMAKFTTAINKFPMNAPALKIAPTMIPVALIEVPVNLFQAATPAYKAATIAIIAITIQVIGQANNAALKPHCAAVAAKVASLDSQTAAM